MCVCVRVRAVQPNTTPRRAHTRTHSHTGRLGKLTPICFPIYSHFPCGRGAQAIIGAHARRHSIARLLCVPRRPPPRGALAHDAVETPPHPPHATCARVHLLLVYGYCMRQRAPLSRCLLGYRTRRSLPAGHRVSVDDRVTPKRAQHGRSVLGRMWPNREA